MKIWTARSSYVGPPGEVIVPAHGASEDWLAPSWSLISDIARAGQTNAGPLQWAKLQAAYRKEMADSRKAHRPRWKVLKRAAEITIVCTCSIPARCHRTWLAHILADGAPAAIYHGERAA